MESVEHAEGSSDTTSVSIMQQNVYNFALDLYKKVKWHYREIEITRANPVDFGDMSDCEII